jgi:hypothetical protein
MNATKKITGRPHSLSQAGNGSQPLTRGKKAEQKRSVREDHRKTGVPDQEPADIEVIFHSPVDVTVAEAETARTRNRPVVHEAKKILIAAGYLPARLSEPSMPVNLIGLGGKTGTLLVFALRSKVPVPSAAKLRELYTGKVDQLRGLAGKVLHTIMIWIDSPTCGWRFYLIYPGGLRYDHDFAASLK